MSHTYIAMMKLHTDIPYLKKIQKIYYSRKNPLNSADISIFSSEIGKLCYIKKYRCRLHFDTLFLILLRFFVSRRCFNKHGYNFDVSRGGFFPPLPIQNRVNLKLKGQRYIYICATWKFKNVNLNSQWHNSFYFIVI